MRQAVVCKAGETTFYPDGVARGLADTVTLPVHPTRLLTLVLQDGTLLCKMPTPLDNLSRREREVYQILYALGEATALDIQAKLAPATKNAATRKILTALLTKGTINRYKRSRQYVYSPAIVGDDVGRSALDQVLQTYFKGSLAHGLLGMVDLGKDYFSEEELEQLRLILKDKG